MIHIEATRGVLKARAKCRTPGVAEAFDRLVEALRLDERYGGPPDKAGVWQPVWPDIPNHRHANLPGAWRACWTSRPEGPDVIVTILFLGTHKEYERLYGFTTQ